MHKIQYVVADSNVKKINFDLKNKVSQRITRNGSDVHIYFEEQPCVVHRPHVTSTPRHLHLLSRLWSVHE